MLRWTMLLLAGVFVAATSAEAAEDAAPAKPAENATPAKPVERCCCTRQECRTRQGSRQT